MQGSMLGMNLAALQGPGLLVLRQLGRLERCVEAGQRGEQSPRGCS